MALLASGAVLPLAVRLLVNEVVALPWLIGGLASAAVLAPAVAIKLMHTNSLAVHRSHFLFGTFLLSAVVASATALFPLRSIAGSYGRYDGLETSLLAFLLFVLASQLADTPRRARLLASAITLLSAGLASHAIFEAVTGPPPPHHAAGFVYEGAWRVAGLAGNPNALGALVVLVLPISVFLTASKSWTERITYGLGTALLLSAAVLTLSRSTWLAAAVGLAMLALLLRLRPRGILAALGVGGLFLVVGIVLLPVESAAVLSRLSRIADVNEESIRFRLDVWSAALTVVTYRPLIGVGLAEFPIYFAPSWLSPDLLLDKPHQLLIETAVNQGLFGLVTLIAALLSIVPALLRKADSLARSIGVSLVAYLVMLQFNFESLPAVLVFWSLAGASTGTWLARRSTIGPGGRRFVLAGLVLAAIFFFADATRHAVADTFARSGVTAADAGCFQKAETLLASASTLVPERSEYALLWSWAALGAGDAETSKAAFERGLSIGVPRPLSQAPRLAPRSTPCAETR